MLNFVCILCCAGDYLEIEECLMSNKKVSNIAKQLLFDYNILTEKLGGRAVAAGGAGGLPDEMPMGYFDKHVATLGQDLPLDPTPQAAVQLSSQRPPVDDDSYTPSSAPDLALAIGVLAEDLDSAEIGALFKVIRERLNKYKLKKSKLFTEALEDDIRGMMADFEEDEPVPQPGDPGYEEYQRSLRRYQDVFKKQAEKEVAKTPAEKRRQLKFKPQRQADDNLIYRPEADPNKVPFLQQVMAITGHSGESGARQWTQKKQLLMWFLAKLHRHKGYKTILQQFFNDFEKGMEELGNKRQLGSMTADEYDAFLEDAEKISQLGQPQNEQLGIIYRELLGKMYTSKFLSKMLDELMYALEDKISTYPEAENLSDKEIVHLAKMSTGEVAATLKNLAKTGIIDKEELKQAEKLANSSKTLQQLDGQDRLRTMQRKLQGLMGRIGKYRDAFIEENVSSIAFDVYEKQGIKRKMPGELKKIITKVW